MAIETIFAFESTRQRHRCVPLFKEREQFLTQMLAEGTSIQRLRSIASMLLHVVRIVKMDVMRMVALSELNEAAKQWILEIQSINRNGQPKSSSLFLYVATKWLRFHDCLAQPKIEIEPCAIHLDQFVNWMGPVRGMAVSTIRAHRLRARAFLRWNTEQKRSLEEVSLNHVDTYLREKLDAGYRPRSMASVCAALRMFFRFTETTGLNKSRIAAGIYRPRVPRYDPGPRGPAWKDVRRLLDHDFGSEPADIRGSAIIALCSIYALRCSEVVRAKLCDFDWLNGTFIVRRAKSGRVQQFPLQIEVGQKIIRYLKEVRPRCKSKTLFVSLRPPYREMDSTVLWAVVSRRLKALKIETRNFGAHALRHACATRLLETGTPLPDIAEFLGHQDLKSVSVYAKHDIEALKIIANFDLKAII
jgi:integrase/recombinase XerD